MRDTVHNVLFHMKYRPDGFVACDIAAHETGKLWHSHPTTTLCYILVRSMDVDMEIRRQSSKFFAQLRTSGTKQEFKTIVYKSMYCVVEREITLSTRHEPSFFFFLVLQNHDCCGAQNLIGRPTYLSSSPAFLGASLQLWFPNTLEKTASAFTFPHYTRRANHCNLRRQLSKWQCQNRFE